MGYRACEISPALKMISRHPNVKNGGHSENNCRKTCIFQKFVLYLLLKLVLKGKTSLPLYFLPIILLKNISYWLMSQWKVYCFILLKAKEALSVLPAKILKRKIFYNRSSLTTFIVLKMQAWLIFFCA